jgi:hypothetical protein
MFRHEFDWEPKGSSTALIFGGAWHAAQEVIWEGLCTGNIPKKMLATRAFGAFLQYWCSNGLPAPADMDYETEKELSPRTPGRALDMIVAYIDKRWPNAGDFQLIAIEKPFVVPLDPDDDTLFYVGKIDKIVKRGSKILGIEHKTTTAYKKNGPFRSGFVDSFSPNAQVDGYLYALHMLFPNEVGGVWVDAALVHKQEEGFTFIPVDKQLDHLDSWLSDTKWWITIIEEERRKLDIERSVQGRSKYLTAFPKNTNSCWDFATSCPYLDLCKAWPNPVGKPVPPGFVVSKWDPLEHIKGLDQLRDIEDDATDKGGSSPQGDDSGSGI